ncbi:hypothetical protein F6X40_35350 [Paraburkholderia sp. UCT31]|uniref:hypothetical protein n=1 Tax=Paraburkholderia sp. UCT31 TaxID=2615209 RepID=UPI001656711E|nr:hypothetical protein [Paraburkholderia sp. UCT31]MBC8741827.1 hypothetical protein [Paraburkholderia sp. UCT31]
MNKTIKLLALNLAVLTAVPAFADETQSFCDMTQAQAEVQKQLLGSAQLFATTGNPATGNSSTITMGISKSLSKHLQARTTGELADATCESYRLDRKLAEQAENVEQRGDLLAFGAMEPLLRKALDLANANIDKETSLRKVNAATLMDVKAAYDARDTLSALLTALQQSLSRIQDQLPEAELPLRELVQEDIAAKAAVAGQASKLQAESAWDVSIAAGAQTDPRHDGRTRPFVGVTVSYSFGAVAANRAASRVASLTSKYVSEERGGPEMQYRRALDTARGLIQAEEGILRGLDQRMALADSNVQQLQGIETDDAQRALRQARLEQLGTKAQIEGSQARLDYLRGWLARNTDNGV